MPTGENVRFKALLYEDIIMDEMNKVPEVENNKEMIEQETPTLKSVDVSEPAVNFTAPKAPKSQLSLIIGGAVACVAVLAVTVALILGGEKHEHSYSEWVVVDEPTCLSSGVEKRVCECNEVEYRTINATGHIYGEWSKINPCDFLEYQYCKNCDANTSQVATKTHETNDSGVCINCNQKIHYTLEEVRQIICINQCILGEYNNEPLIDLRIVWTNLAQKEIDETIFTVVAKWNGEEDVMEVSSKNNVKPGETIGAGSYWEILWPTGMSGEEVTSVKIIYTDGSTVLINGESIEYTRKGYGDVRLDGVIYSLSDDAQSYVVTGGYQNSIVIHSTVNGKPVTKIDGWSFKEKKSLTSVIIEEGITEIGDYAFSFCEKLSNIQFPDSIIKIGSSAFIYTLWEQNQSDGVLYIEKVLYKYIGTMPSNTTLKIPEGIVSVSNGAFDDCKGLVSLYLPSTLRDISRKAFYDCDSLSYIEIAKNNPVYHSAGNCIIETNSKTLVFGCKNSTIPTNGSVAIIGEGAFYDCYYLTQISIPDSVKKIESSAFYGCNKLSSVSIGNGVTEIQSRAFKDCAELSTVTLGTNVQIIGEECFYECYDLTNIVLPDSIKRIEKSAFQATNLKSVVIGSSLEFIGEKAFSFYGLKDIYFNGAKAQWNAIEKGTSWQPWSSYTVHCSNGDIK